MSTLVDQARRVLELSADRVEGPELRGLVADALVRLDEPLRIAVAGRVKAGKSTLVNAMVGELIAPTDARECTRVVTWYRDGVTYRVEGVAVDGERCPLRFDRDGGALHVELADRRPDELSAIEVTWPSAQLREMTIVDTPGIGSITDGLSERTERFLSTATERVTPTDAVLYLLRHVHTADVRFLEAFHDDRMAAANPVNSIGVLSRADEIGAARPDAMASASRIAARWRVDHRMSTLVQTIVPVAGLLAEAARTLRQTEFDALRRLAGADPALVDELLVSVDRFARSSAPVGVVDDERAALLGRLGLFGCRHAVATLRRDRTLTAAGLADQLLHVSGLPALREAIVDRFARRRDLLKSRLALLTAQRVATATGDRALLADVERIVDGAHEFAELRVLNALRSGALQLADDRAAEARRLLGDEGATIEARVGLANGSDPADLSEALREHLARWQARAEHPLAGPEAAAAARVLVRTCEGLLVALTPVGPQVS